MSILEPAKPAAAHKMFPEPPLFSLEVPLAILEGHVQNPEQSQCGTVLYANHHFRRESGELVIAYPLAF